MLVKKLGRWSRVPVLIVLMVNVFLMGCFGAATVPNNYMPPVDMQAVSVQVGTVLYGVQQCLLDKPGTQILIKDMQVLFVWGYEYGVTGLFGIDLANKTTLNVAELLKQGGQMVNGRTSTDLVNWMKANGWTVSSGAGLSAALATAIEAAMVRIASSPLIVLYAIFPVGLDGEIILPGQVQSGPL